MKGLLIIAVLFILCSSVAFGNIQVSNVTDDGIAIRFQPEDIQWQQINNNDDGSNSFIPISSNLEVVGNPGEPMILQKIITIGIPVSSNPTVIVADFKVTEKRDIEVAPYPTTIRTDEDYVFEYKKQENIYSRNTFYPQNIIMNQSVSYIRNQKVLKIIVPAYQYNPTQKLVKLYESIDIDISFGNQRGTKGPLRPDTEFEGLYKDLLVNYEQAKNWRLPAIAHHTLSDSLLNPFSVASQWVKISVTKEGIYKVGYNDLVQAGLDLMGLDPHNFRVYNGGGRMLPESLSDERPPLTQIPIEVVGESDGSFDAGDHILFWGLGTKGWEFKNSQYQYFDNRYTDTNIYWLALDGQEETLRMENYQSPDDDGAVPVESFRDYIHVEENRTYSPRVSSTNDWDFWVWETLMGVGEEHVFYPFKVNDIDYASDYDFELNFNIYGHADREVATRDSHHVEFYLNDNFLGELWWRASFSRDFLAAIPPNYFIEGDNILEVVVPREGEEFENDRVSNNFFEVNYWHQLKAQNDRFSMKLESLSHDFSEYMVTNFNNNNIKIYEVTDDFNPIKVSPINSGSGAVSFQIENTYAETGRNFYVVSELGYRTPAKIQVADVAHLRTVPDFADVIIITHQNFYDHILPLKDHHTNKGLTTKIVDIDDIMDEFAWGLYDPTAIRDYLQFTWDNWMTPPSYLLLVGDGHYDYRNFSGLSADMTIPPHYWGSINTTDDEETPIDDWYCYLRVDGFYDYDLDLSLGRLPVNSNQEVDIAVNKIIRYETEPEFGIWKNTYIFAADDERENSEYDLIGLQHVRDTEKLIETDNVLPGGMIKEKIYLTEYEMDLAGYKRDSAADLVQLWNEGALGVNWIGHGNGERWAHEWIFTIGEDLPKLSNGNKLPLVIAASCDVGRFDNPSGEASIGEKLVISLGKGAIADVTCARSAVPNGNYSFNKEIFRYLFNTSSIIGNSVMYGKIHSDAGNNRKYILFGDPTVKILVPELEAQITPNKTTVARGDTIAISGMVIESDTVGLYTDFNGLATLVVKDNVTDKLYESPFGSSVAYQLPGKTIFKGLVNVENGVFNSDFVIPVNAREGEKSRLTAYIWDGQVDGSGYYDTLTVSGIVTTTDEQGPVMSLWYDGKLLKPGDYVPENAQLTLVCHDPSGVNITGDAGSQISVEFLEGDDGERVDITSGFVYDLGSHTRGSSKFRLEGAASGETQELKFRSFDNFGNVSWQLDVNGDGKVDQEDLDLTGEDGIISLRIMEKEEWFLDDQIANYPNPFENETHFYFNVQSGSLLDVHDIDVTIKIFTVAGRLIKTIENAVSPQIWDGRDEDGDEIANGTYLYKVVAKYDGKTKEVFSKLVVMK